MFAGILSIKGVAYSGWDIVPKDAYQDFESLVMHTLDRFRLTAGRRQLMV
jgi:hypothetical protein